MCIPWLTHSLMFGTLKKGEITTPAYYFQLYHYFQFRVLWRMIIKQVAINTLFKLVCHDFLFCIHLQTSYSYEMREKRQACNHRTPPPKKSACKTKKCDDYFLCLRMSAVFDLSRGDPGWIQSVTVIGSILLKEPGHHVAGVPVTQTTHRSKYLEMCWCFWPACRGVKEWSVVCADTGLGEMGMV